MSFELNEKLLRGREDTPTHTHAHNTVAEALVRDRITLALVSRVWQGNTEAAAFPRKHRRKQSAEQSAEQSAALICQLDQMPENSSPSVIVHTWRSVYTHAHTHTLTHARTHTKTRNNTINSLCFFSVFFFFFTKRRKSTALESPVKNWMNRRGRWLQFPVSFAAFFFPPFSIFSHSKLIKELSPEIIQTGAAKVPWVLLRQDYQLEQWLNTIMKWSASRIFLKAWHHAAQVEI